MNSNKNHVIERVVARRRKVIIIKNIFSKNIVPDMHACAVKVINYSQSNK